MKTSEVPEFYAAAVVVARAFARLYPNGYSGCSYTLPHFIDSFKVMEVLESGDDAALADLRGKVRENRAARKKAEAASAEEWRPVTEALVKFKLLDTGGA